MKSDSQIQQDVLRELKWDHRVKETEIGVEVDSGIVTLTGDVSSYAKKMAAVEAAHRVSGVLDVANEIEVVVPGSLTITDTDIWIATNRLGGKLMMLVGAVMIILGFLPLAPGARVPIIVAGAIGSALVPTAYSWWLWHRKKTHA